MKNKVNRALVAKKMRIYVTPETEQVEVSFTNFLMVSPPAFPAPRPRPRTGTETF